MVVAREQNITRAANILGISQASAIRRIGPNATITKEYAIARVTVTVDPKTKIILKAQCG